MAVHVVHRLEAVEVERRRPSRRRRCARPPAARASAARRTPSRLSSPVSGSVTASRCSRRDGARTAPRRPPPPSGRRRPRCAPQPGNGFTASAAASATAMSADVRRGPSRGCRTARCRAPPTRSRACAVAVPPGVPDGGHQAGDARHDDSRPDDAPRRARTAGSTRAAAMAQPDHREHGVEPGRARPASSGASAPSVAAIARHQQHDDEHADLSRSRRRTDARHRRAHDRATADASSDWSDRHLRHGRARRIHLRRHNRPKGPVPAPQRHASLPAAHQAQLELARLDVGAVDLHERPRRRSRAGGRRRRRATGRPGSRATRGRAASAPSPCR